MKNILIAVYMLLIPFVSQYAKTGSGTTQTLVDGADAAEAHYLIRLYSILQSLDYKSGTVTIAVTGFFRKYKNKIFQQERENVFCLQHDCSEG